MKKHITLLAIALLLIATQITYAMPSITGRPEPKTPAGVNVPTQHQVGRDEPNLEGEWNCLVILIDFPDYTWENRNDSNFQNNDGVYTSQHFNQMLFSEGIYRHPGAASQYTGSMRDYYREISSGAFTTNGVATEWYHAAHPYSYYCNTDGQVGTPDDNGYGEYPANVQGLVEEAIQAADASVDYSDYDNDGNGVVDALFIVHAGPGAEAIPGDENVNYIWSHKWQVPGLQLDGVFVSEYTIEPEDGTVGVFCHEFGHALGLPDLYDTDGSTEGVGEWCLMGGGGWCAKPGDPLGTSPAHMCGWSKSKLDWVTTTLVDGALENASIPPVETSREVYRVWRNGEIGPEYYLIENRQRFGFDAGLTRRQVDYGFPAPEGLLILHVDERQESNEDEHHRLVDVVEASGLQEGGLYVENLDTPRGRPNDRDLRNGNRGDDGDLWPGYLAANDAHELWQGDRSKSSFDYNSIPSSTDYSGEPTFVSVSNIRFSGEDIVCDFDIEEPDQAILLAGEIVIDDSEGGNGDGYFEPGETVSVNIHLRNIGRQDASEVSLLASYNGNLEAQVEPAGAVAYPDVPAHGEVSGETSYLVTLSANAPANGTLYLDCIATCSDSLTFNFQAGIRFRPSTEWLKYQDNPVLFGVNGEWDQSGVMGIATLIEDDTLKVWYIGGDADGDSSAVMGIGYAWSVNGGETFTKYPTPVIVADQLPGWAAASVTGMAVMKNRNSYLMMMLGTDANDVTTLGRATSDDGIEWTIDANPSITADGWAMGIFPFGNLTFFFDGRVTHCGFGAYQELGTVALGTAYSADLVHWQLAPQPVVFPTMNEADFDGYVCFAPDVSFLSDGIKLLYGGFTTDFTGRLGIIDVGNDLSMVRHEGLETGGAVLEANTDDWEAGMMLFGGRIFEWEGEKRILYVLAGENSGLVGLAKEAPHLVVPNDGHNPAPLPASVQISSTYPNPFNGSTVVGFSLPRASNVRIALYDINGRLALDRPLGLQSAGAHQVVFDATGEAGMISSGFYFLSVETSFGSARRGVILLK